MGRYKKGWSAAHQAVFNLYVQGYNTADIVDKTKLTKDRVRNIIRTNKFHEHHETILKSSVDEARRLLESRLTEAAGQIIRIMKHGKSDDKLKFEAAKEILYQCGLKPVEVIETRGRDYTPEEIQSSLLVVKEMQTIEEKLSTPGSGFLLKKDDADASQSAPVTTTDTAPPTEETEVVDGNVVQTADTVGPKTVPA